MFRALVWLVHCGALHLSLSLLNARKTHPDWSLWLIIFHVGVQVHSTSTYRQAELIHELARVSLSIFTSFARLQYLTSAVAWPAHPMPSPPYTASHPWMIHVTFTLSPQAQNVPFLPILHKHLNRLLYQLDSLRDNGTGLDLPQSSVCF